MSEPRSSVDYHQRRGYTRECPRCAGWGEIAVWGAKIVSWKCTNCDGSGEIAIRSLKEQKPKRRRGTPNFVNPDDVGEL